MSVTEAAGQDDAFAGLGAPRTTVTNEMVTRRLMPWLQLLSGFSWNRLFNDAFWLLCKAARAQAQGGAVFIQDRPGGKIVPIPLVGYPVHEEAPEAE